MAKLPFQAVEKKKKRMNVRDTADFILKVHMWKMSNGQGAQNALFSAIFLAEPMVQYIVEYNGFYHMFSHLNVER